MNPLDLTALNAWLATLGPWGILAAAALGFFGPRLLARIKLPSLPALPVAPMPTPPAGGGKLRDSILDALKLLAQLRDPKKDPDQAVNELLASQLSTGFYLLNQPAK